jgi:subtilisin family serine protease/peroxiredoxin
MNRALTLTAIGLFLAVVSGALILLLSGRSPESKPAQLSSRESPPVPAEVTPQSSTTRTPSSPTPIPREHFDSLSVAPRLLILGEKGQTGSLSVEGVRTDGTRTDVVERKLPITFRSSDEIVATVSKKGVVQALGNGAAQVEVRYGTLVERVNVLVNLPMKTGPSGPVMTVTDDNLGMEAASARLIVVFREPTSEEFARQTAATYGAAVADTVPMADMYLFRVEVNTMSALLEKAALIQADSRVLSVIPDILLDAKQEPADTVRLGSPFERSAYDIAKIPEAWRALEQAGSGLEPVVVAVIDTGLDASAGKDEFPRGNYSFVDVIDVQNVTPTDTAANTGGHGTAVNGIIWAANNGAGMNGVLTGVQGLKFHVLVYRASHRAGSFLLWDVMKALNDILLKQEVIGVVNISLGNHIPASGDLVRKLCDSLYASRFAHAPNVLFVIAAGNENDDVGRTCPASLARRYENVIAVGATTQSPPDNRAEFLKGASNYGDGITIAAPGQAVWTTLANDQDGYGFTAGTSVAAPLVTGVVAVMRSINRDLPASQVKQLLITTGDNITVCRAVSQSCPKDQLESWRRLNGLRAIDSLLAEKRVAHRPSSPTPEREIVKPTPLAAPQIRAGSIAPDFELEFMDGSRFKLSNQMPKLTILAFWDNTASQDVLLALQQTHQQLQQADVRVIGINPENSLDEVKATIAKLSLTYGIGRDRSKQISKLYSVTTSPTILVIDAKGVIVKRWRGPVGSLLLLKTVKALLDGDHREAVEAFNVGVIVDESAPYIDLLEYLHTNYSVSHIQEPYTLDRLLQFQAILLLSAPDAGSAVESLSNYVANGGKVLTGYSFERFGIRVAGQTQFSIAYSVRSPSVEFAVDSSGKIRIAAFDGAGRIVAMPVSTFASKLPLGYDQKKEPRATPGWFSSDSMYLRENPIGQIAKNFKMYTRGSAAPPASKPVVLSTRSTTKTGGGRVEGRGNVTIGGYTWEPIDVTDAVIDTTILNDGSPGPVTVLATLVQGSKNRTYIFASDCYIDNTGKHSQASVVFLDSGEAKKLSFRFPVLARGLFCPKTTPAPWRYEVKVFRGIGAELEAVITPPHVDDNFMEVENQWLLTNILKWFATPTGVEPELISLLPADLSINKVVPYPPIVPPYGAIKVRMEVENTGGAFATVEDVSLRGCSIRAVAPLKAPAPIKPVSRHEMIYEVRFDDPTSIKAAATLDKSPPTPTLTPQYPSAPTPAIASLKGCGNVYTVDLTVTWTSAGIAKQRKLSKNIEVPIIGPIRPAYVPSATPTPQSREDVLADLISNLEIRLMTGGYFRLADHKGKVVILTLWASWCPPCEFQLKTLKEIWQEHRGEGLLVVALATADVEEDARTRTRQLDIGYLVGFDDPVDRQGGGTISSNKGGVGLPFTIVFNHEGKIALTFLGFLDKDTLQTVLGPLLKGK